tara:strand:- start:3350 stop:3889 length:540 start_codon:yes stop_codon:yes gene_type:complete
MSEIYIDDFENFEMSGDDLVYFNLNDTDLMFVKPLKTIYRFKKYKTDRPDEWIALKFYESKNGYLTTGINGKNYLKHRLIYFAYNQDWEIQNTDFKTNSIDHIDGDKLNNNIENLRKVTNQQNQWNRTKAKGYHWHKGIKKWIAEIKLDGKSIHLGCFDTEEKARAAYLNVKHIYHPIP